MHRGSRVAVVVPALDEEGKIASAIASVPSWVDHVLVVDDGSRDATAEMAAACTRAGLELLVHDYNRGVGAAIATGYRRALSLGADVTCVMAGDAQMHPGDLLQLVDAVVVERTDYAKGNRFAWRRDGGRAVTVMPWTRYLGNLALSCLTRIATGNHRVFDSQCGYTAISRRALEAIVAAPMFPRYGYPNALLLFLSTTTLRVQDVPVRPVYGPSWRSGIRLHSVVGPIARLLLQGMLRRMRVRLRELAGVLRLPGVFSSER